MKKYPKYPIEIVFPFVLSICLVILFINSVSPTIKNKYDSYNIKDTTTIQPTETDVSGKKTLFIGDSHSVYDGGWQHQLCSKTRMQYKNTAIGGKRTDWMLQQLLKNVDTSYDYCFIWGGANDAASYYPIDSTISNIQKMVNICNNFNIKPIVLTGFDPQSCIDVSAHNNNWDFYVNKYIILQQQIQTQVKYSTIVKNHFISRQDGDCDDFICHMSASGHRKMANGIINTLKFKTY
jgi:lysophospholipase L1-like esterase